MGNLKVANVMDTVYHVCDASGKSNLTSSRDFITINDVISFTVHVYRKNVSRSRNVRTYCLANNNRTVSDVACLDQSKTTPDSGFLTI